MFFSKSVYASTHDKRDEQHKLRFLFHRFSLCSFSIPFMTKDIHENNKMRIDMLLNTLINASAREKRTYSWEDNAMHGADDY